MTRIYDFNAKAIKGKTITLSRFKGQVLLIVNAVSKCKSPQFEGLETLARDIEAALTA